VFTSRPSSTPTLSWPSPSSTIARRRWSWPSRLNGRVTPFFDERGIPLCRVLTDRGNEYCGAPERHEYELYLALENIDHTRTKVKSPQTNGIVERFHKTVLNEFYRVAFRRKIHRGLEEMQSDPRRLAARVQRGQTASGPLVLRQDPYADLCGLGCAGQGEDPFSRRARAGWSSRLTIMNGCVAQQSRTRLHNCRPAAATAALKSGGGRRVLASELLTAGPSGGYLTHYSNRTPGEPLLTVRASTKFYS